MDCPKCRLVNPPTAERCDCGYDFKTRTLQHSYLTDRDRRLSTTGGAALVLLLVFAGIRIAVSITKNMGERAPLAFALILLFLAIVLVVWLWKRGGS